MSKEFLSETPNRINRRSTPTEIHILPGASDETKTLIALLNGTGAEKSPYIKYPDNAPSIKEPVEVYTRKPVKTFPGAKSTRPL